MDIVTDPKANRAILLSYNNIYVNKICHASKAYREGPSLCPNLLFIYNFQITPSPHTKRWKKPH